MPFNPFGPTVGNSPLSVLPTWLPSDDGFAGANGDPATTSGGGALVAGTLYLARLPFRSAGAVANLWPGVSALGVGATTGNGTFVGLWSPTGQLLSASADCAASFNSGATQYKPIGLLAAQAVAAGSGPGQWPYAGVLCNLVTTQVTLLRQANANTQSPQAVPNPGTLRWGQIPAFGALGNFNPASIAVTAFPVQWLWT